MCGIAGLWGQASSPVLEAMLAQMAHRGPDGSGVELLKGSTKSLGLGHRRLAIIDLSPLAHQPMSSSDGRIWITFNGEIYNYRDLRCELQTHGHTFRSSSDTEVIIAAYSEWGERCLERFNGMFAFAIWDSERRRLFLARDRLGIKPLYYAETPLGFAFASEVKSLLPTGLVPEVDLAALNKYLTFLWVPDPDTLFKGVKKLPPAHWMVVDESGRRELREYWDIKFQEDYTVSEQEWADKLLEQMRRSVKSQLVSDVPLGAFLSGGVDSSSIVALMSEEARVHTYTVGFSREDLAYDVVPDDLKYAREVGEFLKTDYHEAQMKPEVIELLPRLVWHMDEPVADPAIITSYIICKAARETLKVLLSGMGGDEVFAGYPRHLAVRLAELYNIVPHLLSDTVIARLPASVPGRFNAVFRNLKKLSRSAAKPFEERYLGFGTYFTDAEKNGLFTPELSESLREFDAYDRHRYYFQRVEREHWINRMLYIDLKLFNPCLNLAYTDKTSMAASLEVRVPFLDHELVELSAAIPAQLKLRRFTRKYILKRAVEPLLPRKVIHRKKAGFTAPLRAWLRRDLSEMVSDLLSTERLRARGYFDPAEVHRLIDNNNTGREDNCLKILQLLVLELWHEQFIDSSARLDEQRTA